METGASSSHSRRSRLYSSLQVENAPFSWIIWTEVIKPETDCDRITPWNSTLNLAGLTVAMTPEGSKTDQQEANCKDNKGLTNRSREVAGKMT